MKTVLITGGTGFLGSHLCRRTIRDGHKVICIDNNITGSLQNVRDLMDHPHFTFLEQNIIEPFVIPQKIDEIYNLACPASPPQYQGERAIFTTWTCIFGSNNVLEIATRHGARILQASTSEIYGDPAQHPQNEDYFGNVNPIGPRACYDEGKRCAESLFFDYARSHNVDIKIVRIFNTYGPSMNPADGRVVSNFIMQALKDEDIIVFGDGSQTRSFCYVDDLIEAMVRMMGSRKGFTGPVNIGNAGEFTIKELAQIIIEKTKSRSKLIFTPLPQDDPKRRRPDLSLAKKELDWEPKTLLDTGLDLTIEYFKGLKI